MPAPNFNVPLAAGAAGQLLKTDGAAGNTSWTNVVAGAAPASATDTGVAGQIAFDATHIYVCVATNTWVRATLATF